MFRSLLGCGAVLSAFADVSIYQLLLVAGVALFASVLGGVAGYGTGALMPLILVPMVGAETVVPIIALAGMLTNTGRVIAFCEHVDWQRALIVLRRRDAALRRHRLRLYDADRQGRAARDRHDADADRAAALRAAPPGSVVLSDRGLLSDRSATAPRSAARSARA